MEVATTFAIVAVFIVVSSSLATLLPLVLKQVPTSIWRVRAE